MSADTGIGHILGLSPRGTSDGRFHWWAWKGHRPDRIKEAPEGEQYLKTMSVENKSSVRKCVEVGCFDGRIA